MTMTVDEATQAVTEGSAASQEESVETTGEALDGNFPGQAARPGKGRPEPAAGQDRAPEARQEGRAVRELKEQRRKRREAEEREAYWRGVAEGRIRPPGDDPDARPDPPAPRPEAAGATPPEGALPDPADYGRYEDYEEALNGYGVAGVQADAAGVAQGERATAETDRMFAARMASAAEADPAVLDIIADRSLPVSRAMAAVIKGSEVAPALVRYLAEHRDEAKRIFDLAPTVTLADGRVVQLGNPLAAAVELGRIEVRLSGGRQGNRRAASRAPEPVTPVGGTRGAVDADDEHVPIEEFVRRRNERQYRRTNK